MHDFCQYKRLVKKLIHIIALVSCCSFVKDEPKHLYIKNKFELFTTDNIGNCYLVSGDEVKKYNAKGELLKVFSNKKLGKISSIDATNPLRILLFYKEQSQLLILDSQLSQNGNPIDLLNINLEQSDVVCTSFNNGIWLFNRQNNELVRLTQNLEKAVSTGNLNTLLNTELKPNFMVENGSYLYLNNGNSGVLIFDIYGTYYKTISLFQLLRFQVVENNLYYYKDSVFSKYNMKLLSTSDTLLLKPFPRDVRIGNNHLYKAYQDSLVID